VVDGSDAWVIAQHGSLSTQFYLMGGGHLPRLGVAEYASGAAYCGEWYLGERVGHGMYFYAPTMDEPHKEYAGQWSNDMLHGIGKRLSKNGSKKPFQFENRNF
jgi:hypothetical protein